jgi:hypothetical protein
MERSGLASGRRSGPQPEEKESAFRRIRKSVGRIVPPTIQISEYGFHARFHGAEGDDLGL